MAIRKFLTSVMDAYLYNESDELVATSKTLIDSSLDVKTGSTEVRGGRGSQLLYVYYHTGAMSITLNDTQWNLGFLGQTVGSDVTTSNSIYTEETRTLGAGGSGSVLGTPLAIQGTLLYGWVTQVDGTIEKVTFSGKTFSSSTGSSGDVVCIRYYATNAASRSITIPANILPKIARIVLEGQLNSSDVATNRIGSIQVIIPKATLTGNFTLSLKSDGVSQTPLTAMALASQDLTTASCQSEPIYAKIIEILDSANWYDGVTSLAISGGDFGLAVGNTHQLVVYAIRPGDLPFVADNAELTFDSSNDSFATVSTAGVVTGVSSGAPVISAAITAVPTIEANAICTVTSPSASPSTSPSLSPSVSPSLSRSISPSVSPSA